MNEFIIVRVSYFYTPSIKYFDQERTDKGQTRFIARANMSSTSQSNAITLKGSTDIVAEFFYYGINSILYQVRDVPSFGKYALSLHMHIPLPPSHARYFPWRIPPILPRALHPALTCCRFSAGFIPRKRSRAKRSTG